MKLSNVVAAVLLSTSLIANAQGYKDGIEYYKAGQFDNAITILARNLNSAGTDKAIANYYLGQAYLSKGDKGKAKTYFDAGIAANPDCAYNYVGLGAIDLLNNQKGQAEENFKKAQKMDKKNSELTVDIARAYFNADPVLYAKEIDKYIEQARKDSKNREPAIYILEGDRKAKERDFNEAARWYDQAITFDTDNPEGYVKYANTYYYVVPDYAIKRLEELLQKKPNSALAQRELAEKYYENGQITRAAAQYGMYMQNPNHFPQDKARYVVLLFADKKYDEAIATANEVLKEIPNDLTLTRIVYRSLIELQRNEEALAAAQKFFNNPEFAGRYNAGDYLTYAQFLVGLDKLDEAEQLMKQARAMIPDDATIARYLATVQNKNNKAGDAFESFNAYIALTEKPSEKDYDMASSMALTAVTAAKDDDAKRMEYAKQGIDYINKINDENNANLHLRKIQILLNRNLNSVDAETEAAIKTLIPILDSDPEKSNPENPNNTINVYRILYSLLASYYDKTGDKESGDNARAKLQQYNELMAN